MPIFKKNDVIQFTENHKWCGCFGYIDEVIVTGTDIRYMVGVPVPHAGVAYVYSLESENDFEFVGTAVLVLEDDKEQK